MALRPGQMYKPTLRSKLQPREGQGTVLDAAAQTPAQGQQDGSNAIVLTLAPPFNSTPRAANLLPPHRPTLFVPFVSFVVQDNAAYISANAKFTHPDPHPLLANPHITTYR